MKGLGKSTGRIGAILAQAILLAWLILPAPVSAQTTAYVSGTDGNLDETGTACAEPLIRSFSVTSNFTVSDVDIGIYATHSSRGGLRMTLQSPAGTRVQIVDGNLYQVSGDNFNVRLNDNGTQTVNTDGNGTNHSTGNPPPFQNDFAPDNPLSAFEGQSSIGTWRLEICNQTQQIFWFSFGGSGVFRHAVLYLTQVPTTYADLSLNKSVSNSSPTIGATISYTLTVANSPASPSNATGVAVTDVLPAGVSYTGSSGFGTYNPSTGLWTVGTLTPGQSRSITITGTVTASAGATITNEAEITASSIVDIDSTPDNGANEDDLDDATFTVSGTRVAGTPPTLMCPKGTILFDWDARAWTTGSTGAGYAVTGIGNVAFSISNPATWMTNYPIRANTVTGGFSPAQYSLAEGIDFATDSEVATTTIALPLAVDGLQFRIFDVDYANNDFADWVRVTGTFGGAAVTPVLTNGVSNYTIGNEAFGDGLSGDPSSDGNVVITFQSAVDTIVIEYGNHSLSPANPDGQAITIHDITFCEPQADIAVSKTSTVIDNPTQGTTDPAAIPGATLSYCILVTNGGSALATSVSAIDPIPANLTFVAGSMQSGASCAATGTAEDDDASGGDDSDAIGASFASNQVLVNTASLGPSESIALRFRATVN